MRLGRPGCPGCPGDPAVLDTAGLHRSGNDPATLTTRQAYDLVSAGFGPGFNGPLVLAAELPGGPGDPAAVAAVEHRLATVAGVARVQPPAYNPAGNAAMIVVYPTTAPQAAATASLVHHLRSVVIPRATAGSDVSVLVGGETAAGIDASTYLSQRLPLVIGLVILLSVILLMAVFRSIAIPLTAAAMNLLSIGAAYGVIVAVYQWGWLSSVFAVSRPGPIDPWIPLMMFTITFGLSMDYEVFLLSRVQEEWLQRGDPGTAVADGIAATGRVITAAAAIMICVFGSFVIGDPVRILDVLRSRLCRRHPRRRHPGPHDPGPIDHAASRQGQLVAPPLAGPRRSAPHGGSHSP
jgi:putative drug exporter of the RND superfamily